MKRIFFFLTVCFAGILFGSCKKKSALTLVMAEVNPRESFVGNVDAAFAEKVQTLSGGTITVDVQYAGALGNEKQVMQIIVEKDSVIQLARCTANLSTYGKDIPLRSSLLSIPYTFRDDAHFWAFANSITAAELLDEPYLKGLGVKGLFYGQEGRRHFFSTRKIESPADLAGKKIRVTGTILQHLATAVHAEPVDVPFTDLYAALATGTVEVAEQPISNYHANAFHKVAPYMVFDGHMIGAFNVIINAACWDSLSKKQQEILKEASQYASDYCKQALEESKAQTIATLQAEGTHFTPVSDYSTWQTLCADMQQDMALVDPALYQKILAY